MTLHSLEQSLLNKIFRTLGRLDKLMVSLTPMTSTVKANSWVLFTCNYDSPYSFSISFTMTPCDDWPITATSSPPGPIEKTAKGSSRTWNVYVRQNPFNVVCCIRDDHGQELIKVMTTVKPGLTDQIKGIFVFVRLRKLEHHGVHIHCCFHCWFIIG